MLSNKSQAQDTDLQSNLDLKIKGYRERYLTFQEEFANSLRKLDEIYDDNDNKENIEQVSMQNTNNDKKPEISNEHKCKE